ncbi:MAG: hypothetical protein SPJ44_08035, partial [Treponema sp.]|nr:hypothetical protein [Treponema sp.]
GEYIPEMGKGNAKDSGSLPGMGGVYNHINFHLYHYAGNNPVRFVDPDGRALHLLNKEQRKQVDATIKRTIQNLDYIINELKIAEKNNGPLNENILNAARKYIKSTFGENKEDFRILKTKLQCLRIGLYQLSSLNVFYEDSNEAYGSFIAMAFPSPFQNLIMLTKSFFEERDSGGWINKEGTLIHEVSHNITVLHTNLFDKENYSAYSARSYMPDKGKGAKQNNASNWEFFYYDVFDPKNNE